MLRSALLFCVTILTRVTTHVTVFKTADFDRVKRVFFTLPLRNSNQSML